MNQSNVTRYTKPVLVFALVFGSVLWQLIRPSGPKEWLDLVGCVAIAANAFFLLYDAWLWRLNPGERIPRLAKRYVGTLAYLEKGEHREKQIEFSFVQRRHSVLVETRTNESSSHSIASEIVVEDNAFVLYYVYRTTPVAEAESGNPIQLGTCRVVIPEQPFAWSRAWILPRAPDVLYGKYWTGRRTCGDIRFQAMNT